MLLSYYKLWQEFVGQVIVLLFTRNEVLLLNCPANLYSRGLHGPLDYKLVAAKESISSGKLSCLPHSDHLNICIHVP